MVTHRYTWSRVSGSLRSGVDGEVTLGISNGHWLFFFFNQGGVFGGGCIKYVGKYMDWSCFLVTVTKHLTVTIVNWWGKGATHDDIRESDLAGRSLSLGEVCKFKHKGSHLLNCIDLYMLFLSLSLVSLYFSLWQWILISSHHLVQHCKSPLRNSCAPWQREGRVVGMRAGWARAVASVALTVWVPCEPWGHPSVPVVYWTECPPWHSLALTPLATQYLACNKA